MHSLSLCFGPRSYFCYFHFSKTPYHLSACPRFKTTAVGRDENGFVPDESSANPRLVTRSDIFKLHGDKVLKGYYEIAMELVEPTGEQLPIRFTLTYVP